MKDQVYAIMSHFPLPKKKTKPDNILLMQSKKKITVNLLQSVEYKFLNEPSFLVWGVFQRNTLAGKFSKRKADIALQGYEGSNV